MSMSDPSGEGRYRLRRLREIVLLTLVLSVGVVGFEFLVHVAAAHATGGAGHGIRDVVISLPMALAAVCAGLWLARRLGYERAGPLAAFSKAAVVSLVFGVALIPSVGIHSAVDSFFGDGETAIDPLTGLTITSEANGSLWGLVQHGVHDSVIGQAVGLPLLFLTLLALGGLGARRRRERRLPLVMRWRGLPRFAYLAVGAATIGYALGGPVSGLSGAALAASLQTSASTATSSAASCATAPQVTFNVSAINVNITLNRFGVHDPNSFMYVLDQNRSAVRQEEQSGQVSFGLGSDPIQPLVLRAHEGDCVTINFTNRTTFGVAAMDQPPAPDPVNGCNNGFASGGPTTGV